jgi:hypothetical protein
MQVEVRRHDDRGAGELTITAAGFPAASSTTVPGCEVWMYSGNAGA